MAKSRRKKGKNARRSRQGLLGLTSTSKIHKKVTKQFEKRDEHRRERKDQEIILDQLKSSAVIEKDTVIHNKDDIKLPHSFVIHTGKVGRYIRRLENDIRQLMNPYTSKALKVRRRNNFKDFVVNGPSLGATHIITFTRSSLSVNMRIVCIPQGPTVHFKVSSYSLARDILASQKRPLIHEVLFKREPLVVMNGFNSDPPKRHLMLVQSLIRHMFPSIDIDTVNLSDIKRVLLVNYSANDENIEFRHYSIKSVPCGVGKSTKKLLQSKVPDLSKYEDISDFLLNPGVQSDSEYEGEQAELTLSQDMTKRGKMKGQNIKIRLLEIGPRLTLHLTKIEEGVDSGEVLYHSLVQKSNKEIQELRKTAPLSQKKRLRLEKNIQHAVVRKLKYKAHRREKLEANKEKLKETLIKKQKEATGEVMGTDESNDVNDEEIKLSASKRFK